MKDAEIKQIRANHKELSDMDIYAEEDRGEEAYEQAHADRGRLLKEVARLTRKVRALEEARR